jgi:hypothetical protein
MHRFRIRARLIEPQAAMPVPRLFAGSMSAGNGAVGSTVGDPPATKHHALRLRSFCESSIVSTLPLLDTLTLMAACWSLKSASATL